MTFFGNRTIEKKTKKKRFRFRAVLNTIKHLQRAGLSVDDVGRGVPTRRSPRGFCSGSRVFLVLRVTWELVQMQVSGPYARESINLRQGVPRGAYLHRNTWSGDLTKGA